MAQHTPHTYATGDTITAALLNQAEQDLAAAAVKADTDAALATKVNSSTYTAGLAGKADLVSGTVPDAQLPARLSVDRLAIDVRDHGAKCDGIAGYYGQATSGSATFTDPTAAFTSALVGRTFTMLMPTGAVWTGTVSAVPSATTLTISTTAPANSQVYAGTTAAITSGSANLTDANAAFQSSWVDAVVTVQGAGAAGGVLTGQLQAVSSGTSVWLCQMGNSGNNAAASTTVTTASYTINKGRYTVGTDDTAAWNAAINLAKVAGAPKEVIWRGTSMVSDTLTVPYNVLLRGDNMELCNPALAWATSGAVLRAHGAFAQTADKPVVQLGTFNNYAENNLGASLASCHIDAAGIADVGVLTRGNLPRMREVCVIAGRSKAVLLRGWQTTMWDCAFGQRNTGDALAVQEDDAKMFGGYLRNAAAMFHLTNCSDFMAVGVHPFGGYGNSNTGPAVNVVIDTSPTAGIGNGGNFCEASQFVGCQFDDSNGPQIKLAPAAGGTISNTTFDGCLVYNYPTTFITVGDAAYPAMSLDTTAASGANINRVSWVGGTVRGIDLSHRFKSFIDVAQGSGSAPGQVQVSAVTATALQWFTTLNGTGPATPSGVRMTDVSFIGFGSTLYKSNDFGTASFTGDGAKTAFTIAHGGRANPRGFTVQPAGATTPVPTYVTVDSANINVNYATAPVNGTALSFAWTAIM